MTAVEQAAKVIASIRGVTAHINKRDRDEAQALADAGLLATEEHDRKISDAEVDAAHVAFHHWRAKGYPNNAMRAALLAARDVRLGGDHDA